MKPFSFGYGFGEDAPVTIIKPKTEIFTQRLPITVKYLKFISEIEPFRSITCYDHISQV